MVLTRGRSNYASNQIEEAFANTDNLDVDTETLLTNVCLVLKKLEANHPHITLSDLQLNISSLLQRLDNALASEKNSGAVIKDLQCNILALESRLEREKQQRQSDLNVSFNELDIIREEKDVVLKNNCGMLSSLTDVKTKLKNKSDECLSLQSLVGENDSIIAKLKSDLAVSNNQKLELTRFVTDLKSSVKKAEEKSWLNSRWVDDTILDTFFQSFSSNNKDSLSRVIFMGPSVTQVVNHGTCNDVKALLGELMFNSFDYAFLCVSNNTATLQQDTGSHLSLLFVDISSHLVYHLDSLLGINSVVAKSVTIKLGFKANSFHELSCTQQNNSYECGLSVLVNAKFINEGFCQKTMPSAGSSFSNWYALFVDGPSGLLIRNKSEVAPSEPTTARPNHVPNCSPSAVNVRNIDQVLSSSNINCDGAPPTKKSGKWVKVKPKGIRTKNTNVNSLPSNHIVKCTNRFQALELESTCINDTTICNSSGKWQQKSFIRQTNKPRVSVNVPNQSSSKVGKETFTHRNVLHSDVRVKVSSDISGPKYTIQANEKIQETPMSNVLLIGDSLLRYSGKRCADGGAIVDINPGAKISHILKISLENINLHNLK
ncbi:SUMO1 sentrin specific peptidase 8 [Homalodisca vitripennis]|nr:SUMO1 sentrin specific peptidase 8 [Homalodisca vitripennis]